MDIEIIKFEINICKQYFGNFLRVNESQTISC